MKESAVMNCVLCCPKALIILLFALAFSSVAASEGPPPVLDPEIYSSPSGNFSLKVDPSDINDRYSAIYGVTKKGTELWSDKLPFTLWEAGITDTRVLGGYAYSHGWSGFGKSGIDDRSDYSIPSTKPKPSTIPERSLKSLGTLVLQANQKPSIPIRDVWNFVFDGRGRIAFLRREENRPSSFVLLDQTGKILREIQLGIENKSDANWTGCTWVGEDRFVFTRSQNCVGGKAEAWGVDVETGKVNAIAAFDCAPIERIIGFPDGSFVALTTMRNKYSLQDALCGFDVRGKRLWTIRQDYSKFPETLFSPEDVAVTTTGNIAILDVIKNKIQIFDCRGKYLRVIDLEKAWGRKPNYLSRIAADINGGFLVNDFQGSPPYVRLKRDGTVRTGFQPKYADGRTFNTPDGLKIAPDGRLWTCDGHAILRLNDSGVVDRILGQSPQTDVLGQIDMLTIDIRGQVYALDNRSSAVHVFEPDGKFIHVCKPKPTDFSSDVWSNTLTISDQGHVYLNRTALGGKGNSLHFSSDGKRLETKRMISDKWYFQPGTGNGLALGNKEVYLFNPDGQAIRTIKRRPDGKWLKEPHQASIAPDGSFAIATYLQTPVTVNIYKANGDPIRTIKMPSSLGSLPQIAYNSKHLVVAGKGRLVIFDSSGLPVQSFKPVSQAAEKPAWWKPYLINDGRQLLLFDGKNTILHRYAMP